MKHPGYWLAALGLVIVLAASNLTIWQRQQVVDHGALLLLDLRPVDPRSLLQGDYMALRYSDSVFPPQDQRGDLPDSGVFVVRVDGHGVASFSRLDDGTPLADDERRLKYKQVELGGQIRLGAESFFFQEGLADAFDEARYGALRVDDAGNSVLVGLADDGWQLIQPGEFADR